MLINGSLCDFFPSSKGLRQKDSLLFVNVMEAFSHLIDRALSNGLLFGFFVGNMDGVLIVVSHLLFADSSIQMGIIL